MTDDLADPRASTIVSTVVLRLDGELTEAQLLRALGPIDEVLAAASAPIALVVDATSMTGYATEAREAFIRWNAEHREQVRRVAVVTHNLAWRMVVYGMGLAARQQLRPFASLTEAQAWAAQ